MNRPSSFDSLRILWLPFRILTVVACSAFTAMAGDPISAIALAPDGASVITGSHAGLLVHSGEKYQEVRQLPCEIESVHDVRFSADGQRLAVAGGTPGQFGLVEILSWPGSNVIVRIRQHDDVIFSISWSTDGKWLATASLDGTCLICDSASSMPMLQIPGHSKGVTGVEWLAPRRSDNAESESLIVTSSLDQTIRVWSQGSVIPGSAAVLVRTMDQHTGAIMGMTLSSAADTQTAPVLASWGDDRTVRFWQPESGRLLRFCRLPEIVSSAVWHADGRELFASMESGTIIRISLATAGVIETERAEIPVTGLALSRHPGKLVSGNAAGEVTEITFQE